MVVRSKRGFEEPRSEVEKYIANFTTSSLTITVLETMQKLSIVKSLAHTHILYFK